MEGLCRAIPDVAVFLALEPEEVALRMVGVALEDPDPGRRWYPRNVEALTEANRGGTYPRNAAVELALGEAWSWATANQLFVPEPGINGNNGWHILSRRARTLTDDAARRDYRTARLFPKELVHSNIREAVWLAFFRGDYNSAVLHAMRQVEIAVRAAGGFGDGAVGVKLVRAAYAPGGPLTEEATEKSEQEARANLFAGAIGAYKNPQSHRHVELTDPGEAFEQVMIASNLLRIVDGHGVDGG